MENTKVSIVIPAYKALNFEQALRSSLGQTYENIEVMVSDNCPNEDIKNICSKYPSVIYQRNNDTGIKNVISSFYSGKGTYIKPLFDDDILHPFCIQKMVATLNEFSSIDIVFSSSRVIDMDNLFMETRKPYEGHGQISAYNLFRGMCLRFTNFIGEFSSIMIRKEKLWDVGSKDLLRIGGHDFSNGLADVAAFLNLAKGGGIFYLDEELSYFRRDARLASNSIPESNKSFGYCISDWIDLVISAKKIDAISAIDTLAMHDPILELIDKHAKAYYQVNEAYQRYLAFIKQIDIPSNQLPSSLSKLRIN